VLVVPSALSASTIYKSFAVGRFGKVGNHILPRLAAAPVALFPLSSTQAHIHTGEESTDKLLLPSAVRLPRSSEIHT
jgi:hypothetical protein